MKLVSFEVGQDRPFFLIAGPCVVESESLVLEVAGRLREVTEIAVEGWLAFVRAACVKWIQSPNISRADLTEMCLRAFDCAVDTPTPTRRLWTRISEVMQSPASSLLRKSPSAV